MQAPTFTPLLTTGDVARRLNVSKASVFRIVAAGRLRPTRLTPNGPYRFEPAELERFVAAGRTNGGQAA